MRVDHLNREASDALLRFGRIPRFSVAHPELYENAYAAVGVVLVLAERFVGVNVMCGDLRAAKCPSCGGVMRVTDVHEVFRDVDDLQGAGVEVNGTLVCADHPEHDAPADGAMMPERLNYLRLRTVAYDGTLWELVMHAAGVEDVEMMPNV